MKGLDISDIRQRAYLAWLTLFLGFCAMDVEAQAETELLRDVLSKPIKIERDEVVTSIPLQIRSGMLHLTASINDFTGEFVFDTGSPTVIDQTIAEKLNLKILGENTGLDSNGREVTMKIALAEKITLGGISFYDVPVMVHDYGSVPLGKCYLPNGVIGSELLPGGVWRIDLSNHSLKMSANIEQLKSLSGSKKIPLHSFGYPYPPIIDYSIGRFTDKALFDTGNASEIVLFEPIVADKWVSNEIDKGTIKVGRGRLGTSAGGIGDIVPLRNFQIKSLGLGNYELENVNAKTRAVPPTLIGRGLLSSHIVTLDYVNADFWLSPMPTADSQAKEDAPGFALSVTDDKLEVSQMFESSRAERAGLMLGDEVVEIDGLSPPLSTSDQQCQTSRRLSEQRNLRAIKKIKIYRNGEFKVIVLGEELEVSEG